MWLTHPENLEKFSLSLTGASPAQKNLVLINEMNLRQHLPIPVTYHFHFRTLVKRWPMDLGLKATWQEVIGGFLWSVHLPKISTKVGATIGQGLHPKWIKIKRSLDQHKLLGTISLVLLQCWCQHRREGGGSYLMWSDDITPPIKIFSELIEIFWLVKWCGTAWHI